MDYFVTVASVEFAAEKTVGGIARYQPAIVSISKRVAAVDGNCWSKNRKPANLDWQAHDARKINGSGTNLSNCPCGSIAQEASPYGIRRREQVQKTLRA